MNDPLEALGLVQDKTARTPSYYCKNGQIIIDAAVIVALKARLADNGSASTIRICLHGGPEAAFHEMIVVHKKGGIFKPHKHRDKDESYHMIAGRMRIDLFNDGGGLKKSYVLGDQASGLPFMTRIGSGIWHATIPESDFAVFHESRPGPFAGSDSILADW